MTEIITHTCIWLFFQFAPIVCVVITIHKRELLDFNAVIRPNRLLLPIWSDSLQFRNQSTARIIRGSCFFHES
jgi:hypothetical protein